MDKLEAAVEEMDGNHSLVIESEPEVIRIPISKNDAMAVKGAFNQLLQLIQERAIQINLKDVGEDLFSQVAKEYVKQLNVELKEIRKEMNSKGLSDN